MANKYILIRIWTIGLFFLFLFTLPFAANAQNNALDFDGTDDYIQVPDDPALTANSLSLEAWIKPDDVSGYHAIASKYDSSIPDASWYFGVEPGGVLRVSVIEELGTQTFRAIESAAGAVEVGVWQHFAVTFDLASQALVFYKNGALLAATPVANSSPSIAFIKDSDAPIRIGNTVCSNNSFCNYFNGKKDELRIWNVARTAAEIQENYNKSFNSAQANLIAYYKFDHLENLNLGNTGINDLRDYSGNNLHGDVRGGVPLASDAAPIQETGLDFDGTNDYVEIPDHPALDLSSQLTVEAWIFLKGNTATHQNIIRKNDAYLLGWIPPSYATFEVQVHPSGAPPGTWERLPSTFPPSWFENKWTHVAFTYESGSFRLYIDGQLDTMRTDATASVNMTNDPLHIGSVSYAAQEFFKGQMAEARIWNIVRTPAEIQEQMNCKLAGDEAGLAAYYPFNQGLAGGDNTGLLILDDLSGNNLDGSLRNFALNGAVSNWAATGKDYGGDCPVVNMTSSEDLIVTGTETIFDTAAYANVIVKSGGVLIIDGALSVLQDMTVESGGLVTHNSRFFKGLNIYCQGSLTVEAGGAINVDAKGLKGGFVGTTGTFGEAFNDNGEVVAGAGPGINYINPGWGGAGGTYGGQGGRGRTDIPLGATYGNIENPIHLGAGGGGSPCGGCDRPGGSGGGLIRIVAGSILMNGTISANGGAASINTNIGGAGSGGGIYIDVDTLAGSGLISANGGEGRQSFYPSGAGGGGRIALYYELNLTSEERIAAYGGTHYNTGAAGTIFLKNKQETFGRIIIDNNNRNGSGYALLKSTASTFKDLNLRRRGKLLIEEELLPNNNLELMDSVRLNNSELYVGESVVLTVNASQGFDLEALANSSITFDSSAVINEVSIQLNQSTLTTLTDLNFPQGDQFQLLNDSRFFIKESAVFTISHFNESNIGSGLISISEDSRLDLASSEMILGNGVTIEKNGKFGLNDQLNSLILMDGSQITHSQRFFPGLNLNAQLLEIQAGGWITADGKGLSGGYNGVTGVYGEAFDDSGQIVPGAGPGINYINPGWGGAGGTYGGQGGRGRTDIILGETYGTMEDPDRLGAGGGGSPCGGCNRPGANGGGLIRINASDLIVNGLISANGHSGASNQLIGGGGSGGGIKITTASLSGEGTIRANGGLGTITGFYPSGGGGGGRIAAYYETSLFPQDHISAFGGNERYPGAAGTIYLKASTEEGALIIDNGNRVSQSTTRYSSQLNTIRVMKVARAATFQFSLEDVGGLTVEDSLIIEENAQVSLDSAFILNVSNTEGFDIFCFSGGKMTLDAGSVLNADAVQLAGGILETSLNLNFLDGNNFELSDAGQLLVKGAATFGLGHFDAANIKSGLFSLSENTQLEVVADEITIGEGVTLEKDGNLGEDDFINALNILQGGLITSAKPGLKINCNYFTLFPGAVLTHQARDLEGLYVNAREKLEIQLGGLIDVSQKGLRGGFNGSAFGARGEAFSEDGTTIIAGATYTTNFAGGASYGGLGAVGVFGGDPNPAYGDQFYPEFLGSGGSSHPGFAAAGHGGGRIALYSNNLIVDGDVLANGGNGGSHGGGGSGGSILVYANAISGSGFIRADGGNGGCGGNLNQCSGSGGGGRIAIYTNSPDLPAANVLANPGVNNSNLAEEGTIVYQVCAFEHNVGVDTVLVPPPSSIYPQDTTILPTIVVRNYSPSTVIFPVSFDIGAFYADETFVNLEAGERDTIVFSPWKVAQTGTVMATAQTNMEGDDCIENNEKQLNIGVDSGEGPVLTTVSPESGGNTGSVTVRMTGLHFDPGIKAWLEKTDGSGTNFAHYIDWKDDGSLFASFDLSGLEAGLFDVFVQNPDGQEAVLAESFSIEEGPFMAGGFTSPECLESSFDLTGFLETEFTYPQVVRRFTIFPVIVQFKNISNIDVPLPARTLISINENPVSFSEADLKPIQLGDEDFDLTLLVRFEETDGPANILRAGASGTFKFYCKALNTEAKFKITE